jgi:hypothetical protein
MTTWSQVCPGLLLLAGISGCEAADADLTASQEALRDTLVSLLAEVARNYINVVALEALGGLGDHRAGSMKVPGLQLACLGSSPTLYCGTKSRQLS